MPKYTHSEVSWMYIPRPTADPFWRSRMPSKNVSVTGRYYLHRNDSSLEWSIFVEIDFRNNDGSPKGRPRYVHEDCIFFTERVYYE